MRRKQILHSSLFTFHFFLYLCSVINQDCFLMMKIIRLSLLVLLFFAVQSVFAQLPQVTLKTMDGKAVRIDTLSNNGKPIVISFFATWCKPCNRELDTISEVYDEWQEETGVKIIAISQDQAHNIHKVKPFVDHHGWTYDLLLDPNSDMKRALGFHDIPFSVIVDGQGKIVYRHLGYTDGEETELIEKLRELTK